ncbi:MAG: zinc-dependent alcohol dehydrogenase family protein [Acidobacteriia bacterium]|nr:zinc-dependent alcohol dehydrogenase family protein [Terriglobia bacterium]
MRAMVLHANAPIAERPLEPSDAQDPEPGAGEVRVRVRACAICRTDLHVIEGELPARRLPLIPGHQVVGTVDRLGPGCTRRVVGERVGIAWLRSTCGACAFCRSGSENLCELSRYTGYHADGGYAELAVVPEAYAYRLPEAFSDLEAAPLLCAGIIGYRALRRSDVPAGGRLGLYGFGSSAHVVLQIARHRGCEIHVATRGESHRELARRMGAVWVGGAFDAPPVPLDAAIVFAPVGEIVPRALRSVRRGGTVVLAGIYMTPVPSMAYDEFLFHEKNLRSVEANTRADGEDLLREAAEIPLRPEVTTFPLEHANEALVRLKQDRIDGTGVLIIGGPRG